VLVGRAASVRRQRQPRVVDEPADGDVRVGAEGVRRGLRPTFVAVCVDDQAVVGQGVARRQSRQNG
jgi:hypothetical protein